MFYADIGKKRFSAYENSAAFRPSFRHSETAEFEICFQNPDGSPFDLSGCTLQIALDDDFDHRFPMISHPADNSVHIVDAAAGTARFTVSCSSRKFERVVRHGPAVCSLEIIRTVNGSAEGSVILQEENIALLPRLYTDENVPAAPEKDYYYTKPQIDAMIRENLTVRLGACGGLGIQYGETGCILSWTDPDDVVVNGAELARWKQTVLIRKLNKYPSSVFDGVCVARTVREDGTKSAAVFTIPHWKREASIATNCFRRRRMEHGMILPPTVFQEQRRIRGIWFRAWSVRAPLPVSGRLERCSRFRMGSIRTATVPVCCSVSPAMIRFPPRMRH